MSSIIAIVGRPNVGKSTLYNRLTESKKAIVDDTSGVTRDRHYGLAEWAGKTFTVVDTGGYVSNSEDVFETAIREQVLIAVEEAAVILFMLDVKTGITDLDNEIASVLRKSNKPVFVIANKVDNNYLISETAVFYSLGLGEVYPVSSIAGSGTGELLDEVTKHIKPPDTFPVLPKYAIVGRPNVGKSSLINALLGQNRNIVTPIAGTTRDSIHIHYKQYGHEFMLIDTAGLRKKAKVKENIEFYSVMRTIRAIEEADVVLLVVDALEGIQAQDVNIFHLAEKNKKGLVVLVNKWDLIIKDHQSTKAFEESIRKKTAPSNDFPIVFTSALQKQRIFKAIELANQVYQNKCKKIATSELNKMLLPLIAQYPPPSIKGKHVKIKYITQIQAASPAFAFFCNLPQYIKEPYQRFLENKLREKFNFHGAPVQIFFRQK